MSLFHREIMRGIYLISDSDSGPTDIGDSLAPGTATANSYLVVGTEAALLLDLTVDRKGLWQYACGVTDKPVRLALSHAHIDHIYHIEQQEEVWVHPADEVLLREGCFFQPPVTGSLHIHHLNDGDRIDLGGRTLDVIHFPGHTDGSILLLDHTTRTLLSGDTIARRLLYGMHSFVPLENFCRKLKELEARDFDVIYSAHDRSPLPKAHIGHMQDVIGRIKQDGWINGSIPVLGDVLYLEDGNVYTANYFDFSVPLDRI